MSQGVALGYRIAAFQADVLGLPRLRSQMWAKISPKEERGAGLSLVPGLHAERGRPSGEESREGASGRRGAPQLGVMLSHAPLDEVDLDA